MGKIFDLPSEEMFMWKICVSKVQLGATNG